MSDALALLVVTQTVTAICMALIAGAVLSRRG